MTEKIITKKIPEETFYDKIRIIRNTLESNTKNILNMFERINTEVLTPPLTQTLGGVSLEYLKNAYKKIPLEILKHTPQERQEYVINERNKIIKEELGPAYETLARLIKTKNKEETILDVCKIVFWKCLNKENYLEDKISKHI